MFESTLTNLIYDTLLNNDKLSGKHTTLDPADIEDQECDAANARLRLRIEGRWFTVTVTREHCSAEELRSEK